MSDLKYQKLLQLNERLRQEEELPRIPVSEASKNLVKYIGEIPDPLPHPLKAECQPNPFTSQPPGGNCCVIL